MQKEKTGKLFIVATPIGNLQDITLRAIDILKSVDKIAVEDTRHATVLLNHFSIQKPTFSLHEHNEHERIAKVIEMLQSGESVALISDAGTPLINDPGYKLVRQARESNLDVIPIPGACAAIAALSVAGLPTNRFSFEGFLPTKAEACRKRLETLANETQTMIFYETPHRILMVLEIMATVFGPGRQCVVAREITKLHENILYLPLEKMLAHFKANDSQVRGEFVICVAGIDAEQKTHSIEPMKVLTLLLEELPIKQAAALASKITGERKNILYDAALKMKQDHK